MNLFQWLTLSVLLVALAWEVVGLARRRGSRRVRLMRCVVWAAAGLAIARPDLPSAAASALGIQRGADLVFYFFCLTFLAVSFYFYSRYVRLQRQITEVVRHLAIQGARRGGEVRP